MRAYDRRLQRRRGPETEDRAAQMSVVADVVRLPLQRDKRADEKTDRIQPAGNHHRQEKGAHHRAGKHEDVTEDHTTHAARRAVRPVFVMPVNPQ